MLNLWVFFRINRRQIRFAEFLFCSFPFSFRDTFWTHHHHHHKHHHHHHNFELKKSNACKSAFMLNLLNLHRICFLFIGFWEMIMLFENIAIFMHIAHIHTATSRKHPSYMISFFLFSFLRISDFFFYIHSFVAFSMNYFMKCEWFFISSWYAFVCFKIWIFLQ